METTSDHLASPASPRKVQPRVFWRRGIRTRSSWPSRGTARTTWHTNCPRKNRRPAGFKRRQDFLRFAKSIELRSSSRLYLGKALGIPFDRNRLHRVGIKIALGIIYHDAKVVVTQDHVICFGIPLHEVREEREGEIKNGNSFWVRLSWDCCLHDMFADSVAVRRVYFGHPTPPDITIECVMAVISSNHLLCCLYRVSAAEQCTTGV
jgi:hypothetical protein